MTASRTAHTAFQRLRGAFTPLVTPFRAGAVDYDTYARLVERQVDAGAHGLLVNGTTAEPSTLSVEERNRLVDIALEQAGDRLPIVAATGSQSHAETVALSEHAADAGVDALLIVTPYYLRPPQRGLVAYYRDLCSRVPLPVMLYHIPGRAAVSVTTDTLAAIMDEAPNFVGIKHAVDDLGFVTECMHRFGREFRVFVGLEELSLPMLVVGSCGLMNAVGNLVPQRLAAMCDAVSVGDLAGARALHDQLFELNRAVFFDTNPIAIKYMMHRLGLLAHDEHRLPLLPPSPETAARLDRVLEASGLLEGVREVGG